MRTKTLHFMAMSLAFAVSAGVSFVAHGADLGRDYDDPGASYKPGLTTPGSWQGWYAGALVGYGLANTDLSAAGARDLDTDGVVGGGIIGYDWQLHRVIFGIEGDLLAGGLDDSVTFGANTVNGEIDWMGGLRARAGILANQNTLFFLTLGYGWADYDLQLAGPGGGAASETFGGLQLGGGGEFKLNDRWRARIDYIYTDLSSETITYSGGTTINYDADLHQIRGGLVVNF